MSTAQELQAQIDKMSVELDNLRKQVIQQGTKNFANRVSNAEEQFIANRAKESGIDMSAPLPNEVEYERALRKYNQDINDRANFTHFSRELKKDLDSKKKKGGKSKRNSHKRKSHKHKSQRTKR